MRRIIPLLALLPASLAVAGEDEEMQRRTEEHCAAISTKLEAYLGPKFKAPVPVAMRTKEEIGAFAREQAKALAPQGLVEMAQKLSERLRLVPHGYDLFEKEIEMVEKNVAGLYDPDADRFYVVKGTGSPGTFMFMVTAAHELVHAYRDVDKDYWPRVLRLIQTNSDAAQAVRFLVEGDATLLGDVLGPATIQKIDPAPIVEKVAAANTDSDMLIRLALTEPRLAEFPLALKETLVAAYVEGRAFAAAVFRHGGKEALDRAYDNPPRSTEQTLHPEKYLGAEPDEPVGFEGGDPTAALGEGWKRLHTDVIGEFDVRVLFTERLDRRRARAAAEGWDGARYWFCEKAGTPSFIGLTTAWDTAADAREFAQAWADWALRRDGATGEVAPKGDEWRVETGDGLVVVTQAEGSVVVADGVPPDRVAEVLSAMRAATRR
jgi:hypothetical protein